MTVVALIQIGGALPTSLWEMIMHGTLSTRIVLGILGALSLVSWMVMLAKWREFRSVRSNGATFMHAFEHARDLDEVAAIARKTKKSPFTHVFNRALLFVNETKPALAPSGERTGRLSGSQVEALRLVLDAETNAERDLMARFIPWLATIGSASPLIGLFGTVLGVISAFTGIATGGSGNIGAVAPGIAEALIATAAALAVAIPAVFGYNIFATRLNRLDSELEGFGSELIALMVREGRI